MLHRLLNGLVDLMYPKTCLACKNKLAKTVSIDNLVCIKCWGKIQRNLPPFCHCCGRQLKKINISKSICPQCQKIRLHFDRAFSPCVYTGAIKELIHEFKYKSKDYLGPLLSRLMVEFIKEYNLPIETIDFIVPVPLHTTRLREREFNQSEILSRYIAREFKKDAFCDVIQRHRLTKTQTELQINKRLLNVQGGFSVTKGHGLKGKHILLVDDVLTTGATCSEAAKTLKDAGANIVFVLTLAN